MKSVVITGCNRGIGLGFVKQFVSSRKPPEFIIATCRDKSKADSLNDLALKNPNLHILEVDLKNFSEYSSLVKEIDKIVGNNGINALINNAGISTKFSRVGLVKVEQMTENFIVNTVAPLMLAKAHIPLLKRASEKNKDLPMGTSRAAIINISSVLGSIEKNYEGGFYPYRCSKSALNTVTKSLSIDLKNDNILVISLHPGWCKTNLGGKNAPLDVDHSVSKMLQTIESLNDKHNGTFIQYDGVHLPW